VPATPEATEELSTRIAFIKETHCMFRSIDASVTDVSRRKILGFYVGSLARGHSIHITRFRCAYRQHLLRMLNLLLRHALIPPRLIHVDSNFSISCRTQMVRGARLYWSMVSTLPRCSKKSTPTPMSCYQPFLLNHTQQAKLDSFLPLIPLRATQCSSMIHIPRSFTKSDGTTMTAAF